MPATKDAEAAVDPAVNEALTYVLLGELDGAAALVAEGLEAVPGRLTIPLMRLDPRWKNLVEDPRFEKLVAD